VFPTSILQSKISRCIYVCIACGCYEASQRASKFENYFAIRTVRFQVQLEAGGYFSAQKFSSLQPQQTGRVGTASQFLNQIFQIQLQKRLLSFAQTRYSAQNCAGCTFPLIPNKQIFLEKKLFQKNQR
jgi:hypothetical protein